ncbi:GNAT family N-acetyltransferase [Alkalihalobacillus sp. MEB130]|uniref:GNAT family N-acetyltransferase n=1 Tax=Alkalihalobacillus sp. MEB130 TaxID=2976704 RepID=UPI0028EB1FCD|nr:GNAT family N-acetyltransferase [Alkalihalobacillus sp. MEB130]
MNHFVAKDHERFVGFVQLYPTFTSVSMKKAWILNDLYVKKEYRRSGVAQQLIQLSIELCNDTGAKFLSLETAATNIKAQNLYKKMGFVNDQSFLSYTFQL